jgi:hypothetical protein
MSHNCESCGMPIECGHYCQYCVDASGQLQDFDTRFERMVQWRERRGSSRARAEAEAIAHMAIMPAWKDHPKLMKRVEQ